MNDLGVPAALIKNAFPGFMDLSIIHRTVRLDFKYVGKADTAIFNLSFFIIHQIWKGQ